MQFVPPLPTLVQRHERALIVGGAGPAAKPVFVLGLKWRMAPVGVILGAGLDGRSVSPVRRSAEGVASCRPTCASQAQSYAPQGAPLTLRLPPVAAGSPFAHRAPDVTAVRLNVSAVPQSQAETLLAHIGQEALMALLTEATEG